MNGSEFLIRVIAIFNSPGFTFLSVTFSSSYSSAPRNLIVLIISRSWYGFTTPNIPAHNKCSNPHLLVLLPPAAGHKHSHHFLRLQKIGDQRHSQSRLSTNCWIKTPCFSGLAASKSSSSKPRSCHPAITFTIFSQSTSLPVFSFTIILIFDKLYPAYPDRAYCLRCYTVLQEYSPSNPMPHPNWFIIIIFNTISYPYSRSRNNKRNGVDCSMLMGCSFKQLTYYFNHFVKRYNLNTIRIYIFALNNIYILKHVNCTNNMS